MMRVSTNGWRSVSLTVALVLAVLLSGCGLLPGLFGRGGGPADIAVGVADMNGLARVESAAGVNDFQVTSGLTGERLTGVRIRVAVFGGTRLLMAEDPTGAHLPVAVPLTGEATVRRLVMPARTGSGYNITTAAGPLNLDDLELVGTLSEEDIRARLLRGPNQAVLIYLYNPARPLALTNAPLQAYSTPFENVTVLRAAGEPSDATLGLVTVGLQHLAYETWSNRFIDRYLAARIGQQPDTDLRGDLAFRWSYPVYDVFPPDEDFELGDDGELLLRVNWRSQNPDPPPPWSFFVTTDDERLVPEPEAFQLGPDSPPAEVRLVVNRAGLAAGEYTATLFIQPFSDAFGMIEQPVERTVTYTVDQSEPTPTPGPSVESLQVDPSQPRTGQTMTVTAEGFEAGEPVLFEMIGAERTISDTLQAADGTGFFTYLVDLGTVPAGSYTLRVTGAQSGIAGELALTVAMKVPDAVVRTGELNLRIGPGYDYPVVDVLAQGDELDVIAVNWDDSWLEVTTSTGRQGWVVTDLVELSIPLDDVPWNSNFPAPQD